MLEEDEAPVVHGNISSFTMVPYWITERVSGNAHKLYSILLHYADNQTLVAWPSRATLAEKMGMNRPQSLDRYIEELEQVGALTVKRRQAGGVNLPNQYKMSRSLTPPETSAGNPQEGSAEKRTTSADKPLRVVPKSAHELEPGNYNQDTVFDSVGAKRATTIPASFAVSSDMEAWAREKYPDVDQQEETAKFVNYHKSKGKRFKDWAAAWRNWIINADKYRKERQAFQPQQQQRPGVHNMAAYTGDPYEGLEVATWR